jgi:hypothetical protein
VQCSLFPPVPSTVSLHDAAAHTLCPPAPPLRPLLSQVSRQQHEAGGRQGRLVRERPGHGSERRGAGAGRRRRAAGVALQVPNALRRGHRISHRADAAHIVLPAGRGGAGGAVRSDGALGAGARRRRAVRRARGLVGRAAAPAGPGRRGRRRRATRRGGGAAVADARHVRRDGGAPGFSGRGGARALCGPGGRGCGCGWGRSKEAEAAGALRLRRRAAGKRSRRQSPVALLLLVLGSSCGHPP